MRVPLAEDIARDNEQFVFDRAGNELRARPAAVGHFGKYVERASRWRDFVPGTFQPSDDQVPTLTILVHLRCHVGVERRDRTPLQRMRRANERVLLQHRDLVDHRRRSVHPAQSPAGHAVRFAEPVDDDRLIVPIGRAHQRRVVAELAIDLVRQQGNIVVSGQLRESFDFVALRDDSGRVGRTVEQNEFRLSV